MAKIGNFNIMGRSGVSYRFDAYPMSTVWAPMSAVYVITHRDVASNGTAAHIPLSLGHVENLQALTGTAITWAGHRANCICVLEEKSEERRLEIATDIAGGNSFPA